MPMDYIKRKMEAHERAKEIKRTQKVRQARVNLNRQIANLEKTAGRYWELAKRALKLGDKKQFRQYTLGYMWMQRTINQGNRSLLALEAVELRRDQAQSTAQFLQAMEAMSHSILDSVSQERMAEIQATVDTGLQWANDLTFEIDSMLDSTESGVFGTMETSDTAFQEQIAQLEKALAIEAESEDGSSSDSRIEEMIKRIENEMREKP